MTLTASDADVAEAAPKPVRGDARRGAAALARIADLFLWAGIAGAVLLSHPYQGIMGDGMIYVGRALADLDPDHVGRDLMFRFDGQSAFSIFRFLARWCIAHLGIGPGVWLMSVGGLVAFSLAIACCVRSVRPGRAMAVVLAAALLLPRAYAPSEIIAAGEAFAIPRPWAEASVLLAIAGLAEGRIAAAFILVALAAAFHPIMALPGLVLIAMIVGAKHAKRLLVLGSGALLLIALAGWAGLPVVSRAFERIDPTWLNILRSRNSYLFVGMWTLETWSQTAVMIATLLVGASYAPVVWGRIMRCTAAVALLGCLASFVGADLLSSLLFTQVQLWRSLWLAAALAPVAAGICLMAAVHGDWKDKAIVAALAAAWISSFIAPVNALLAILALCLAALGQAAIEARLYKAVCAVAALIALCAVTLSARMIVAYLAALPPQMHIETLIFWRLCCGAFLVIAFVSWCASLGSGSVLRLSASILLFATLSVALVEHYDDRTDLKKDVDSASLKPDLVAMLAQRPGEILWIGDEALWYWARRANWNERLQGAGIVFSRDLALLWHERAHALVALGLEGPGLLDPRKVDASPFEHAFDADAIGKLCARPDAPAWIVMPLRDGVSPPTDPRIKVWTAPFVENKIVPDGAGFALRSSSRRLVIPCSAKAA